MKRPMQLLATSAGAAGAGVALMFFLDPNRGEQRRAVVRDKATRFLKECGGYFAKAEQDLANRVKNKDGPVHAHSPQIETEEDRIEILASREEWK
jgi:hypothetical protein